MYARCGLSRRAALPKVRAVLKRIQTGYRVIVAGGLGRFFGVIKQARNCKTNRVLREPVRFRILRILPRLGAVACGGSGRPCCSARGRSFVSGISVLLGLCSLNPALLYFPAAVALRYYRACIADNEKPQPASSIRARSLSFKNNGGRSAAHGATGAASSHGDEDYIARAAASHQERLAGEAHEWPTRATQATRRDGRR